MHDKPEIPIEIARLIQKYRNGRIPPLIRSNEPRNSNPQQDSQENDNDAGDGLLSLSFVNVYRAGIGKWGEMKLPLMPGGLLRPTGAGKEPWKFAEYIRDDQVANGWRTFCRKFRGEKGSENDQACEGCDRVYAQMAADKREIVAYLCHAGLIDFAVPVLVKDEAVAVFFSGQIWPKSDPNWSSDLLSGGATSAKAVSTANAIDIAAEAKRRLKEVHTANQHVPDPIKHNILTPPSDGDDGTCPEMGPERVSKAIEAFKEAADHLSRFSEQTYDLEKSKIVAWIRAAIGNSLAKIEQKQIDPKEYSTSTQIDTQPAWEYLRYCLPAIGDYYGFDFLILITGVPRNGKASFYLWERKRKDQVTPLGVYNDLYKRLENLQKKFLSQSSSLEQKEARIFYEYKEIEDTLISQRVPRNNLMLCYGSNLFHESPWAGIAALKAGSGFSDVHKLRNDDKDSCEEIFRDFTVAANLLLSIEEWDEILLSQELFMESVAHDIRNPIQTVLFSATNIEDADMSREDLERTTKGIAASIRRIHAIGARIWTDRLIQRHMAPFDERSRVNVLEVISSCIKLLGDQARQRAITIPITDSVRECSAIHVNRELFAETVQNLLDNAIKYSDKETEILIEARGNIETHILSFRNRGVWIPPEELDAIFKRYYRSKAAETRVRQGSGIGLSVVKAFADYHGNIKVSSEKQPDGSAYTTFKLTMRKV